MQKATAALQQMLTPPKVVEFDFSHHTGVPPSLNVASARVAALLLNKVLTALVPTLYGENSVFLDGEYYCEQDSLPVSLFTLDKNTLTRCQVRVALSSFSPTCAFSRAPFNKISLRCKDSMSALLSALTLTVAELTDQVSASDEVVHFSLLQYHSLLDHFGASEEVKEVLRLFTRTASDVSVVSVRNSEALNSLNLSANPSVSYINQLTQRLHSLESTASAESNKEDDATLGESEQVTDCLDLAARSIERRHAASHCALAQDFAQAAELLTEGLLDLFDPEEGAEENSAGEKDEFLLPGHIKVFLWTDRY
jgi:hypothetical protein